MLVGNMRLQSSKVRLCSNVPNSVCTVTCLEALDARNAGRKVAPKNSEARVSASSCLLNWPGSKARKGGCSGNQHALTLSQRLWGD